MAAQSESGSAIDSENPTISLFTPVSNPLLRSVSPVEVAKFLKGLERYEIEISSSKSEIPSLKVLPFTASIDRSLLRRLFYMGKFDTFAPNFTDVKKTHRQSYSKIYRLNRFFS